MKKSLHTMRRPACRCGGISPHLFRAPVCLAAPCDSLYFRLPVCLICFCVGLCLRRPMAFLTSHCWTSCVRSCCFYASLRSGRPRPPVHAGAPVFAAAWVHRLQAVHSLDVSRRFLFGCDGAALRRAVICLEFRRRDRSVACPSLCRKASLRTCCRFFSIHRAVGHPSAQAPS